MDEEHLLSLYDASYAGTYDGKFLQSDTTKSDTAHELEVLETLLRGARSWLDVACGTGFYLSRFPGVQREGLDLSPGMLRLARDANPGVTFHQRSFLAPTPTWRDRWDVVSCMWYAYGYVSSMSELETLVANLAEWTAPTGVCFVPLAPHVEHMAALFGRHFSDIRFDVYPPAFPGWGQRRALIASGKRT